LYPRQARLAIGAPTDRWPPVRETDGQTTKPKVTGSNPVGRAPPGSGNSCTRCYSAAKVQLAPCGLVSAESGPRRHKAIAQTIARPGVAGRHEPSRRAHEAGLSDAGRGPRLLSSGFKSSPDTPLVVLASSDRLFAMGSSALLLSFESRSAGPTYDAGAAPNLVRTDRRLAPKDLSALTEAFRSATTPGSRGASGPHDRARYYAGDVGGERGNRPSPL
jgi:hypothetical protein